MKCSLKILTSIFLLSGTLLANDSPHWQVDGVNEGWRDEFLTLQYFHNSELQRQWAWHLLGSYHFAGNEDILDFGCGDGKITAEISHFIPQGHIFGVDLSPSMINFAHRCFPSAHYPNVTFSETLDVDFNSDHQNKKYDMILSFCVFHLVPNPTQILKNLRSHLASHGKLLLVIPAGNNPAFFQAANEVFEKYQLTSPWSSGDKGSNALTMRTKEGCLSCLASAGLEAVSMHSLHTPIAFFNKQELVEWMIGTVAANWQVPMEIADAFFTHLVDRMVELDSEVIDKSGAYYMKLSRIEVIAKSI